jgi:hypothetical protein
MLNIIYGFFLPLSQIPLLISSLGPLLFATLFLIAIFTRGIAFYTLTSIAILSEHVIRVLGVLLFKLLEKRRSSQMTTRTNTQTSLGLSDKSDLVVDGSQLTELERARKKYRIPAYNIEHHVERLGAFVTIVLGEMVVNIFFNASLASGLNACVPSKTPPLAPHGTLVENAGGPF